MSPPVRVLRYGVVPYGQALAHQLALRERLIADEDAAGWILCLEHEPVVTIGKRGRETDIVSPTLLEERGVELFRVDRGGELTFHGPGQLVVYPILKLSQLGLGVVDVVRGLASALAETLAARHDLETSYDPEHPGLWTSEQPARKIGSVGMRVSRGVSTHGAALNLVNDMIPFSWIVACGMPNAPMTRLQDYVDVPVDLGRFTDDFLPRFASQIGTELVAGEEPLPGPDTWIESLPLRGLAKSSVSGVASPVDNRGG